MFSIYLLWHHFWEQGSGGDYVYSVRTWPKYKGQIRSKLKISWKTEHALNPTNHIYTKFHHILSKNGLVIANLKKEFEVSVFHIVECKGHIREKIEIVRKNRTDILNPTTHYQISLHFEKNGLARAVNCDFNRTVWIGLKIGFETLKQEDHHWWGTIHEVSASVFQCLREDIYKAWQTMTPDHNKQHWTKSQPMARAHVTRAVG